MEVRGLFAADDAPDAPIDRGRLCGAREALRRVGYTSGGAAAAAAAAAAASAAVAAAAAV